MKSQFKSHFQHQELFWEGNPVLAAPYRYGYLHSSAQCIVSSHKTTSKQNTYTTNCYCFCFLTMKQLNMLATNTATTLYIPTAPT